MKLWIEIPTHVTFNGIMHINTSEDTLPTQLKRVVDRTSERLQWDNLSLWEALELTNQTRVQAEKLIPGQIGLYQLIYTSRF